MGFFRPGKPQWRHKDPNRRLEAVNALDPRESELLYTLALEDQDSRVRRAAINRLNDPVLLERLAGDVDPEDMSTVISRRETLLCEALMSGREDGDLRGVVARISSPDLLARLAVEGGRPELRLAAVERIESQTLLADIVRQNCGRKAAVAALAKITDLELLADLAGSAASKASRRVAAEKVAELDCPHDQERAGEIATGKLNDLLAEVRRLQTESDMAAAALKVLRIREQWMDLDPAQTHPLHDDFSRACNDFDTMYEASRRERRRREQEAAARRAQALERLVNLCGMVERLSCVTAGDAEGDREEAVRDWEALVNSPVGAQVADEALRKRFATACRIFESNREVINRERALVQGVEKLIDAARRHMTTPNLSKAGARLAEAEKRMGPLELKFFNKAALEKQIRMTRVAMEQARQEILDRNLARRREICATLEELMGCGEYGRLDHQLRVLRQEWRQLAEIDNPEATEAEQRFHELVDRLADKRQALRREKDWQLWANLRLKEELVERVVAFDREEDLETVVRGVQEAQAEWKKIGPVPRKKSQELWDRFHGACRRNFERAAPFLEELREKRAAATKRRREICALTAELADSSDWKKTARIIKGFQEEWKTLPHGSRREEQKLYRTFRASCDHFFARRQEFYQSRDAEWCRNLAEKEKLCEQAEQMAAEPKNGYAKEFKRLQAQWKKIGPVPRDSKEAVWKRFRNACDIFFNWLEAGLRENLAQKEELCLAVEKLVADPLPEGNWQEIINRLTELQKQWREIGPVPRDRSDALRLRFREPIDRFFAFRRQQLELQERQRRANQEQKEELLARAVELAGTGTGADREVAGRLQDLQKQWFDIGPAPRGVNRELNDRFKALCDAFFENRRRFFSDLRARQLANQRKKERLCLRLENMLGISYQGASGAGEKALSLAEELKLAMQDNFMLAGRRREKKGLAGEVKRIRQEWEKTGPVPYDRIKPLNERYKKALDTYYQKQRQKS